MKVGMPQLTVAWITRLRSVAIAWWVPWRFSSFVLCAPRGSRDTKCRWTSRCCRSATKMMTAAAAWHGHTQFRYDKMTTLLLPAVRSGIPALGGSLGTVMADRAPAVAIDGHLAPMPRSNACGYGRCTEDTALSMGCIARPQPC